MTTIFILILFLLQIIGFYFIVLLNTKVAQFDNLEKKQQQLMREMDDSIAAYLAELKDENDRLIHQLDSRNKEQQRKVDKREQSPTVPAQTEEQTATIDVKTPVIPINIALKSYGTSSQSTVPEVTNELQTDERSRAFRLHDAGESIENIAKTLGKGKTEVELLLKFR